MSKFLTPMENAMLDSPSKDRTVRFIWDQDIRAAGYQIVSRPKIGEAVWQKHGQTFTQSEVIQMENWTDS